MCPSFLSLLIEVSQALCEVIKVCEWLSVGHLTSDLSLWQKPVCNPISFFLPITEACSSCRWSWSILWEPWDCVPLNHTSYPEDTPASVVLITFRNKFYLLSEGMQPGNPMAHVWKMAFHVPRLESGSGLQVTKSILDKCLEQNQPHMGSILRRKYKN